MTQPQPGPPPGGAESAITVLLVDDQALIGEAVRRALAGEPGVNFHYCQDPTQALRLAAEVKPTVILQDLVMPELDGLTLVKYFRANPATREVPLIVLSTKEEPQTKAQAFALGANDYLVKLPDKVELIARVRHHSAGYLSRLQRDAAYRALEETQAALFAELAQAAEYVRSLIPPPLTAGPVELDWRFLPSQHLGGDSLGHHWLDEDHLALYVLDVCGHGIGSALLSVSVMNVLRSRSLPQVDFHRPEEVLAGLNLAFPMEAHNNTYFTMWYGVFDRPGRRLAYATAGHPAALLLTGPDPERAKPIRLETNSLAVGILQGQAYERRTAPLEAYAQLFVYSDGAYEVQRPDGSFWTHEEFLDFLTLAGGTGPADLDRLLAEVRRQRGEAPLEDDLSLVTALFV